MTESLAFVYTEWLARAYPKAEPKQVAAAGRWLADAAKAEPIRDEHAAKSANERVRSILFPQTDELVEDLASVYVEWLSRSYPKAEPRRIAVAARWLADAAQTEPIRDEHAAKSANEQVRKILFG